MRSRIASALPPNPGIDFASTPFVLNHDLREWKPANGAPAAYTHMNAEPISPSWTLSKPNSSLSLGNTE